MSTPDGALTNLSTPPGGVQITLQSIYLKDCSYESPNGPRLPDGQTWDPKFQLNMNTTANEIGGAAKEIVLTITLEAKHSESVLYLVEVKQAGIFTIEGGNNEDLQRIVGSFCPNVLFPYARESISALVAKGGFPAFLLPLVNFDALLQQAAAQARPNSAVN
jgi:preprotein translocase subunit SecB